MALRLATATCKYVPKKNDKVIRVNNRARNGKTVNDFNNSFISSNPEKSVFYS
jgi:hypothetical protein